jgi:hypothetical protein
MNTNGIRLIKSAATGHGFRIGIIEQSGTYSVIRMNENSKYITISRHKNLAAARNRANAEWSAETR